MKKVISVFLAVLILSFTLLFTGCKNKDGEIYEISFSQANSLEEMKKHDGDRVSVMGYMSTLSPVGGKFAYLMNMPYQSCPYCIPNTTTLSNTIAVYAKEGKSLEFTDLLIRVDGILEFGAYTDEYGYEYSYRIKDATYTTVDTSELSDKVKLWQQLAASGVIADVYAMYDYINYLCFWGTYTYQFEEGQDYLHPSDVGFFLVEDGAQFNYGYKDGYFDGLVKRIEDVDPNAFADLVNNIREAQALAEDALAAIEADEYEMVSEYSNIFGDGRDQYRMKDYEDYEQRIDKIFTFFSTWLAGWEL